MNSLNSSGSRNPLRGTLAMVSAPMGLLLAAWFTSGAGSGAVYSRGVITAAQVLLLFLPGMGLASGIIGTVRRDTPRWISLNGLVLTICAIGATGI
jgi:hypothetical protein